MNSRETIQRNGTSMKNCKIDYLNPITSLIILNVIGLYTSVKRLSGWTKKKKKASLNYFLSKETHTKYKTLIRDKFFKLVNGEIYYVHRLEDSKIIKISIPTKLTCKYNPVPIKISTGFYTNWQSNFKMHMEIQRTKKRQNNFEKNKVKGFILPDFRSYLKVIVIKRTWYSYKDKQIY